MTGTAVLLLAEDDAAVALVSQTMLEDGGYSVIVASCGSEAIKTLDERVDEIAGLVTDIRLGDGPDGWEVARHARELNPKIAVVYTTGDSAADWAAQGVPKSLVLQKPFVEAQLLTGISTLLNEADSSLG
jgi:CheY-like chemotaxis protein